MSIDIDLGDCRKQAQILGRQFRLEYRLSFLLSMLLTRDKFFEALSKPKASGASPGESIRKKPQPPREKRNPSPPSEPPEDPIQKYKGDFRGHTIRGIVNTIPVEDEATRIKVRLEISKDLNLTTLQVGSASGWEKRRPDTLVPTLRETLILMDEIGLDPAKYRKLGANL